MKSLANSEQFPKGVGVAINREMCIAFAGHRVNSKDVRFIRVWDGVDFIDQNGSCYSNAAEIPEKKMRLMTPIECTAWACSEKALGWVISYEEGCILPPQYLDYSEFDVDILRRARISEDGIIGEREKFEKEVSE